MHDAEHHIGILVFIAIAAVTGMILTANPMATGALTQSVPQVPRATLIITGLDLNDNLGQDIETLTSQHLSSLSSGIIYTQSGKTRFNQILRLTKSDFTGGNIVYGKSEIDEVADFIKWESGEPLFEYELEFNPGLEGELADGKSDEIEGNSVLLLGKPAFISRVEAEGNQIKIRFFTGSGEVEFTDSDVTDNQFEDGVEIGGRNIDAKVKIKGSVSVRRVRIFSIQYRPEANSIEGDIYVPKAYGLRGRLQEPQALLNPSFEIIYGGMSQGSSGVNTTKTSRGQSVHLRPSGNDEYKLAFTNNRGQSYLVPSWKLDGSISLGKDDDNFVVVEGNNNADFNINDGDYFLVSSGTSTGSVSNVLRLQGVTSERIYIDDLAGDRYEEVFDSNTGEGILTVAGRNYRFIADPANERIVVDQTGDGSYNGDRARIILQGGVQLELYSSSMQVRVPTKLFNDDRPSSDEITTVNIIEDNGEINSYVSGIDMEKGRTRIESGMSNYGILFELDDRTPADLMITIPRAQAASTVDQSYSGQTRGWIVVTTERERFLIE